MKAPAIRLAGGGQRLARALWLGATLISLYLWLVGAYATFSEPLPSCITDACDPFALSLEDQVMMRSMGLPAAGLLIFWNAGAIGIGIFFFLTAAFIFWRSREDAFALVVSFCLVSLGAVSFTEFDDAVYRSYPLLRLPMDIIFSIGWTAMILVFFYFPDGRQAPGWRWLPWALVAIAGVFAVSGSAPARSGTAGPIVVLLLLTLAAGLVAQVYRYRKISSSTQRQQTKWVLFGLTAAALTMVLWIGTLLFFPPVLPTPQRIWFLLLIRPIIILLILLLPMTIAFSILRYRLWDIDLIVRRTVTYTLVTGILAAVYFSAVVLLQALFSRLTGQANSPLITVLSTLAIAALFNPLRGRVQDFIDRGFYRQSYDAERILRQFAATAREEVDMDRLAAAMLEAVDDTLQPASANLWLQPALGLPTQSHKAGEAQSQAYEI